MRNSEYNEHESNVEYSLLHSFVCKGRLGFLLDSFVAFQFAVGVHFVLHVGIAHIASVDFTQS